MKSPLAVIFLTITLDLIGFGMIVPMLPLYAQQLGASGTMVALLFAAYSLMQFFFAPWWGALSDRVGRRPVLLFSIAGNVLALCVFGMAHSYGWLLAARLCAGLCTANISVANAYVADVTKLEERARGMGMVGAAFGIGFVIGPFIGGELSRFGYSVPPFVAAALSACNFVAAYKLLPESLPPERRRTRSTGAWQERWALLRSGKFPVAILSLIFLQVLGFSMMEMALSLFAKLRLGFDAPHSGRIFAFVGIVLVIVQGGLIGRLSRWLGEVRLVWCGLALVGLGLAGIPLTPADHWLLLLVPMALLGVGQGLCSPALSSLLSKRAAVQQQGATLGLSQSVSALARVLGPSLAGIAFDRGSENWPFFCGAALISIAWLVSLACLSRQQELSL